MSDGFSRRITTGSERESDEDRLIHQAHPERVADAVADLVGQCDDVCGGRRTPVGHGKGVFGGQSCRAGFGKGYGIPGPVDQPCSTGLDETVRSVKPWHDDLPVGGAQPGLGATLQLGIGAGGHDRVGEERAAAPRVVVRGVEDHPPLTALVQHGRTCNLKRHALPHLDVERARQICIGDGRGQRCQPELEHHVEDDIAGLRLEERVAIGEPAVGIVEGVDRLLATVPDPNLRDGLGDLLAVGADVLDRGCACAARDAGERLDAGPPLGDSPDDHVVPDLTSSNADRRDAMRIGGLDGDPSRRDADHGTSEAIVGDDQVRAAADDQQRLVGVVNRANCVNQLVGGLDRDQALCRATYSHGGQARQPDVMFLSHECSQSRTTTAVARPSTLSVPHIAVSSTVPRLVWSSTAATTAVTTTSAPLSYGTTTGLVNRVPYSTIRPASPTQSLTMLITEPMVNMPWAMTSGSPTDVAKRSSQWMRLRSRLAPVYWTRLSRLIWIASGGRP